MHYKMINYAGIIIIIIILSLLLFIIKLYCKLNSLIIVMQRVW